MFALLACLACLPGPGPHAPVRYRFESRSTSSVDLTAYGQPNQDTKATTVAILSVTTRDSAGGRVADIVIDSIVRDDGGVTAQAREFLAPEMTASGKGAVFHLFLLDGRVKSYSVSMPVNLEATAVSGAVGMIFPSFIPNMKVGASWTDTTVTDQAQAVKSKSSEINRWTLVAEDTLSATVSSSSTSSAGGNLGTMTTTASGTRKIAFDRGLLVRDATLTMASDGVMGDVKIKGTTSATLTRLP